MNSSDTQLTEHAIERFVHFLRDSRRHQQSASGDISQDEYTYASQKLREIMRTATYRKTDVQGRELWRSPPSAYGLRWLVAYEDERRKRKVVWVGAGRPPNALWEEPV